jgi:hypothetical protein
MTTQTTTQAPDANDFLMGGGDGVPSSKFPDPGAFVDGIITAPPKAYQEREYNKQTNRSDGEPKTFPSGDPIMSILVDLQTNERDPFIEGDTGIRRVYIQGKNLKQTVKEAILTAGGRGLEVGARLRIDFTHRDDPMDKGSAKNYTAQYTTAANMQLVGGQPAVAQPVAQVAPAPTVAQPVAAQPVAAPAPVVAPAPAAPAADPVAMARQLLAVPGMTDQQIGQATGLDPVVIGAIRNAG